MGARAQPRPVWLTYPEKHHNDGQWPGLFGRDISYESLGENDDSSKRAIIPLVKRATFRFPPIFTDFSDFLGRLQPSTSAIQKTPDTMGVEESSSPRRVLLFECSNSSRGRMRAEL